MPEIVITEVDSGRFFTKTEKVWAVAAELIRDFLAEADAPAGKYAIRVHKQVRWMGNPTSPSRSHVTTRMGLFLLSNLLRGATAVAGNTS